MTELQYAKWLPKANKYEREIQLFGGKKGKVDVYRVLSAFDVKDPELQRLVKKGTMRRSAWTQRSGARSERHHRISTENAGKTGRERWKLESQKHRSRPL